MTGWTGRTDWTVSEYIRELCWKGAHCNGRQEKLEAEMEQAFKPSKAEKISDPCVITDKEGIILLWYLPGLLSRTGQVCNSGGQAKAIN
jgi:hypothetical protein